MGHCSIHYHSKCKRRKLTGQPRKLAHGSREDSISISAHLTLIKGLTNEYLRVLKRLKNVFQQLLVMQFLNYATLLTYVIEKAQYSERFRSFTVSTVLALCYRFETYMRTYFVSMGLHRKIDLRLRRNVRTGA